jgi:leucyl aminopeptidase
MIRKISFSSVEFTGKEETIIIPLFKETSVSRGPMKKIDAACGGIIKDYLSRSIFAPDNGETLLVAVPGEAGPANLLLLGVGERAKFKPEKVMQAAGNASKLLQKRKFEHCHLLCNESFSKVPLAEFLGAFIKGFALAAYSFSRKADDKKPTRIEELTVMTSRDRRPLAKAASRAQLVAEHIIEVRDMVNTPANELTPSQMAAKAKSFARRFNLHCRILGIGEIKKKKMGGVAGVAKGSAEEPKVIILHYNRNKNRLPLICLVGKGVTFDSGGISLKPWEHMDEMKGDMAGGALVMSTIAAAARLKIPLQIMAIIPCVENMPGQRALKPGDIITTYSGKTIEILSTDAEGRLILSDAISYAGSFAPRAIIDFATLTGACVIALGKEIAGVMGNNQKLVNVIVEEGRKAGEPVWQLPLTEAFSEKVKGDIADYKNFAGRDGSTISAAALLGRFAEDIPWAHVDIAGPFLSDNNAVSYKPKGGTGYGVDLALRVLETLANKRMIRNL